MLSAVNVEIESCRYTFHSNLLAFHNFEASMSVLEWSTISC